VGRYQKGKTNLDFTEARDNEWQWHQLASAGKSAPCSRQITTPVPHHSVFYRPDALPAAQPTASKHSHVFKICSFQKRAPKQKGGCLDTLDTPPGSAADFSNLFRMTGPCMAVCFTQFLISAQTFHIRDGTGSDLIRACERSVSGKISAHRSYLFKPIQPPLVGGVAQW